MIHNHVLLSPEVSGAFNDGKPVVALESTIIAHGMPYPQNVQTAIEVENIIRGNGAIPATIAIINGQPVAGLTPEQLELLGRESDVVKASIRDLPFLISQKRNGATTVAATMRIAAMTGIKVFVTGGIGGVHRGAENTMDISADLTEMSMTNVAVISAGVKSILDIGRTLEVLETSGIPVITYGSDKFPSFYSAESGFKSPFRLDDVRSIAAMLHAKWNMQINGAVLIANPIPIKDEIPFSEIEKFIKSALIEAEEKHITGKDVTPFLLKRLAEMTEGRSLQTNIALIKNNAKLGAEIAKALA